MSSETKYDCFSGIGESAWNGLSMVTTYAKTGTWSACVRFSCTISDVNSSATETRQHPDLRTATSNCISYLNLPVSSKLRPQTAHRASHSLVQYQVSLVRRIAMKERWPYRWESSPEKLFYLHRTKSHLEVIPTLQETLSSILNLMQLTIRLHPNLAGKTNGGLVFV